MHTWPELGTVALDLYTCNVTRDNTEYTLEAFEKMKAILQPSFVKGMLIERGTLSTQELA
jgi:S-adenosylmethionine/arginine decarboxylase-like enzyme